MRLTEGKELLFAFSVPAFVVAALLKGPSEERIRMSILPQDNTLPPEGKSLTKSLAYLIIISCAGVLGGCATSMPPTELIDARQAYAHASAGQAAQFAPAEIDSAHAALAIAEQSFRDDPKSSHTRDLANIAYRKARLAEALGATVSDSVMTSRSTKNSQSTKQKVAE